MERTYASPEVGTVIPLRSEHSEDSKILLAKKIADAIENEGWISSYLKPHAQAPELTVRIDEYMDMRPVRKHENRWIDGGKQLSVLHPDTCLPFFLNSSGSEICRLCNGKHTIRGLIVWLKKEWCFIPDEILVKDLMQFLLLLKELDLLEIIG